MIGDVRSTDSLMGFRVNGVSHTSSFIFSGKQIWQENEEKAIPLLKV